MTRHHLPISFLLSLLLGLYACQGMKKDTPMDYKDYMAWMSDPSHGMVKEKRVNGLLLKVKYIPSDLAALKTKKKFQGSVATDSSATFLLSIGPENELTHGSGDLMMADVKNFEEYKEKFNEMHFQLGEYARLQSGPSVYEPTLFHLEPTYGLGKELTVTFVFSPKSDPREFMGKRGYDFVFDDRFFNTGKSHFVFLQEDLQEIPRLKK